MITEIQSEGFKKIIGARPGSKLSMYFIENEILNKVGNPFSESMITRVLSGKVAHRVIERAIYDYCVVEKEKQDAFEKKKNTLVADV